MLAVLLAVVTVFYGLTQTGSGDSTRVRGTVTTGTPNGARVANAWVTATSGSDVRVTRADAHGDYVFLTLLPGVYHLSAYRAVAGWHGALSPRGVFSIRPGGGTPLTLSGGTLLGASYGSGIRTCDDDESLVELSAGIEYQANLDLRRSCR